MEEVINLCFRKTVITPLILQQNPYLCLSQNPNMVSRHARLSLPSKNTLSFLKCRLVKKRALKSVKPCKLLLLRNL